MTKSDCEKNVVRVGRRPMMPMTKSRKSLSGTMGGEDALLTRKQAVVIKRPAVTKMDGMPQMASKMVSNAQTSTGSQMRSQQMSAQYATQGGMSQERRQQVNRMMAARKAQQNNVVTSQQTRMTSQEIKQQAITKALNRVANTEPAKSKTKVHFGFKRILLATFCAAVAVFAIVYFVNLNAPNISLKVAAMQSGIEAVYPAYVPRGYRLSDITSENGKVVLNFNNTEDEGSFTIIEEKSSWDSNALFSNYVKEEYGDSYTVIREQGLTLYVCGSNAAWVNGGVAYKIKTTVGSLSKKQIKSIAVSL